MTKTKTTKRALVASILSLLLCVSMLVGSTFAWFTDSVTVGGNKIVSGKLEIKLYQQVYQDAMDTPVETEISENAEPVFGEDILWEPGYTAIANFRIENVGNLAAKVRAQIVPTGEVGKLAEVIDVYVCAAPFAQSFAGLMSGRDLFDGMVEAGTAKNIGTLAEVMNNGTAVELSDGITLYEEGIIEPDGEMANNDGYLFMALKMQETAGNDYQEETAGAFDIRVLATQASYENDSFDDQYDKDAEYAKDLSKATDLVELFKKAAESASEDIVINLEEDFNCEGWIPFSPKGYNGVKNVTINGNGHILYNLTAPLMIGSFAGYGTVTVNDLVIADADISGPKYNNLGLGAIVAYSDASGGVVFSNCKVKDSKIECTDGYAGGLIGYTSSSVTVKGCSVTGSTIVGGNSSGAICGQFAAPATVEDCTVTDTAVSYANGDEVNTDGWRVGVIVGTADVGTVTMKNITESGNTLSQGTVVAPDHSNLYGRSLGNGITLDGEAI